LITVIRQQFKQGADFIKIYQTGRDSLRNGVFTTPYQYTEAEMTAAVQEAARIGKRVAVHATGEPGTGYAAKAGVSSVDHAYFLSEETMRLMAPTTRQILYVVPDFNPFSKFPNRDTGESPMRFEIRPLTKIGAAGVVLLLPIAFAQQPGQGRGPINRPPDARVQQRTYHFQDTNEDLPGEFLGSNLPEPNFWCRLAPDQRDARSTTNWTTIII
jgi:hypothetical protein